MKVVNRLILLVIPFFMFSCNKEVDISVVDRPDTGKTNSYYVSNRAPLEPSVLIKLPVGDIKPGGWLEEIMLRQADGLAGHLGEISKWLQKEDNAWLSADGSGKWGWEEVPYWLKGFANMGYILDDQEIVDEAMVWIEGALSSQREDGNFGPRKAIKSYITDEEKAEKDADQEVQDYWSNMIMLYCLRSYYEYSEDQRVIDLMTKYFRYQLTVPDEKFLSEKHYWQRIRGGDNLAIVMWLYNVTGDEFLLELAEKVHMNTAPWNTRGHEFEDIGGWKDKREGTEWPDWYCDLIDWHNVNIAQGFREPAQYFLLSHDKADLDAAYDNFNIVREHFGQVPGGMFGSDENCRPGYDDPRQAIETCGIVEQMNSDEHLLRITGDIFWADHTEDVAFNTYPVALMPDMKSLRYLTSPNMIASDDKDHSPGIMNPGPHLVMNPFSSRCCQHNHAQGWPYFTENLWMATPDNGLAAVIYAASSVKAKVGAGDEIEITSTTNYPFEDSLQFVVKSADNVKAPLYFRIPGWCDKPVVSLNGEKIELPEAKGKFVRIERKWNTGDEIVVVLPMDLRIKRWEANHNSASIYYGPLAMSLRIEEKFVRQSSVKGTQHDSGWQSGVNKEEWPSYQILPGSDWNYGLLLDNDELPGSTSVIKKDWPQDNYPFTLESVPLTIKVRGKKIPGWTKGKYGLVGELRDSPVMTDEPEETIELVPMGAAHLRISAFPVVNVKNEGADWE